jgi:hypothetical protein
MKAFTIVVTGSFQAETPEAEAAICGQVIAAGRVAFNALPGRATSQGAVTVTSQQRDGYHQKVEGFTYPLEASQPAEPVPLPAVVEGVADVTDVPGGS